VIFTSLIFTFGLREIILNYVDKNISSYHALSSKSASRKRGD